MKKKLIFSFIVSALFFSLAAINAKAQNVQDTINGLNETAGKVNAYQNQTSSSDYGQNFLTTQVGRIIGIALSFVGVIFLLLMIYAGIMWMIARGNEQEVSKAKDLLTNAVVGLIIVFAAYALTSFIGTQILQQ